MKNYKLLTMYWVVLIGVVHFLTMTSLQEVVFSTISDENIKYWARISCFFSNITSSGLLFGILILLSLLPFAVLNYIREDRMKYNQYYIIAQNFYISYLLYELIKMVLIWLFIANESSENYNNIDYITNFSSTDSGIILLWLDFYFILIIPFIFFFTYLFKVERDIPNGIVLLIIVFILFCSLNISTLEKIGII